MLVGYCRVSTTDQDTALQEDALIAAGCERIFRESASGASRDRPELAKARDFLRPGDVLVCWRLDRLSRSLTQLLATAEDLERRGIQLRSLQEQIDTTTPAGKMIFAVMGALAEFERAIIRERTAAGIAAARARGRIGGRPRAVTDAKLLACKALLEDGSLSVEEVARQVGISAASVYRYFPKARTDAGRWAAPKLERIPDILAKDLTENQQVSHV